MWCFSVTKEFSLIENKCFICFQIITLANQMPIHEDIERNGNLNTQELRNIFPHIWANGSFMHQSFGLASCRLLSIYPKTFVFLSKYRNGASSVTYLKKKCLLTWILVCDWDGHISAPYTFIPFHVFIQSSCTTVQQHKW